MVRLAFIYYMEKGMSNRAESVPVSKLPQLVQETKQDLAESGLKAGIVGSRRRWRVPSRHKSGELNEILPKGNFHSFILFKNDEQLEKVSQCVHRLVKRAIALDGTCKLVCNNFSDF